MCKAKVHMIICSKLAAVLSFFSQKILASLSERQFIMPKVQIILFPLPTILLPSISILGTPFVLVYIPKKLVFHFE